MFFIGGIMIFIGVSLISYGSFFAGKKNYDINVNLQTDVEDIIKTEIRKFLEEHRPIKKDCQHKWETIKTGGIRDSKGNAIGTYYHLKCENCGNLKKENLVADI